MAVIPSSNLDPNAAPWGRWVTSTLRDLIGDSGRNSDNQANSNKQLNSSIKRLAKQINDMPYVTTAGDTQTGVGLNGSFVTKNTVTIPVIAGKTVANVMVIVNAEYLDTVSAGAAVASGRIFIGATPLVGGSNGVFSQVVSAAKQQGASVVDNILNIGFTTTLSNLDPVNLDPNIYITFQAMATNANAYPSQSSNFSQVSVQVTYTN